MYYLNSILVFYKRQNTEFYILQHYSFSTFYKGLKQLWFIYIDYGFEKQQINSHSNNAGLNILKYNDITKNTFVHHQVIA